MKGESRVEAIVYTTNTGSAAQYAKMLAKETGLAAYSLDEARGKVPADSEVIYLGWVMAGTVKGYAAAAKRYIVRAVCAVGMAQPGTGEGYDMNAIAAAVIGGASLAGGRGAVTGTLLGTVLMVLITNAGTAFKIDPYILDVTTGVLIIFAVAMDMMKSRKKG